MPIKPIRRPVVSASTGRSSSDRPAADRASSDRPVRTGRTDRTDHTGRTTATDLAADDSSPVLDVRYVESLPLPDGRVRLYWEQRRPDGAHELRTEVALRAV